MTSIWIYATEPYTSTWFPIVSRTLRTAGLPCQPLPATLTPGWSQVSTSVVNHREPTTIVCLTNSHDPYLEEINRTCCATQQRLIVAGEEHGRLYLGPGVVPGTTACWACFQTYRHFFPFGRVSTQPLASLVSCSHTFVQYMAHTLIPWLRGHSRSPLHSGAVLYWDPATGATSWVRPFKDPLCGVCSMSAQYPTEMVQAFQYAEAPKI